MGDPRVKILFVPGDASHVPAARFQSFDVPEARLDAYRACLDGIRYDKIRRARIAPLDKLAPILRRLREEGFPVDLQPEALAEMRKRTLGEWFDYQAVRDRIRRIDDEIEKRTQREGQKGDRLFRYQIDGIVWLSGRTCGLLADDMGLGKTRQIVTSVPSGAPVLVVAPAKVKIDWKREFNHCRPAVPVTVMAGRKNFRWPLPGEVVVLNYEILPNVHEPGRCTGTLPGERCVGCLRSERELVVGPSGRAEFKIIGHTKECGERGNVLTGKPCPGCASFLKTVPEGTVFVGDELHKVKDQNAGQTKRFRAMAEAVRTVGRGRTWGVTGTPIENHPKDLFSLYLALGLVEESFGDWSTFVELFKGQKTRFGWSWELPDADDTAEIASRIRRVSLRRLMRDVHKDMPPKTWQEIDVDVDAATMRACADALAESGGQDAYEKMLNGSDEILEKTLPKFQRMSATRALLASAKIPAMLEQVESYEEKNEPLIVFCNHRAPLEILGKRHGWRTIIGGDDQKESREAIDLFQAGALKGIACSTRAAGAGITLTRGRVMLFVDRDYTPTKNAQAEARFYRIGQGRPVLILILKAKHPLDARQAEISLRKQKFIELGVDAAAVNVASETESKEFEEAVKAVHDEAAEGRAVRREPAEGDETKVLDDLHVKVFGDAGDVRLANLLAEEAVLMGLSDRQWALAARVAERGKYREEVEGLEAPIAVEKEQATVST